MRTTRFLLVTTAVLAIVFCSSGPGAMAADAALAGKVSSAEEGAMEGVVVSARKDGSTIRISVVTDAQGQYSFPASKLEPGSYKISIRAAGFDLDGTGVSEVVANKTATADLKLKKTANLASPDDQCGLDRQPAQLAGAPRPCRLRDLPYRAAGARTPLTAPRSS